ncbi:MAG: BatD family protein, partial [bacterium]
RGKGGDMLFFSSYGMLVKRKAKIKALVTCAVIFVIGALLFPLVVYFGAICMCIYSVTLFKILHVVWKNRSGTLPNSAAPVQEDICAATEPSDDARFMPPEMRHCHSAEPSCSPVKPVIDLWGENVETGTRKDKSLSSYLVGAVCLFVIVAILSLILRPILEDHIRKSVKSSSIIEPNVQAVTNQPSLKASIGSISAITSNSNQSHSQPYDMNLGPEWQSITNIPYVNFAFPTNMMELQSVDDRQNGTNLKRQTSGVTNGNEKLLFLLQPKGLATREPSAFTTYMRIFLTREPVTSGNNHGSTDFSILTRRDLTEYTTAFRSELSETRETYLRSGQTFRVLKEPFAALVPLAKTTAIKAEILLQIGTNPVVVQSQYQVLYKDHIFTVITQFWACESNRWEQSIHSVLQTIRYNDGIIAMQSPNNNLDTQAANIALKLSSSCIRIHLGESFNLMVEVDGADFGIDTPRLSAIPPAEFQFIDQHSNTRSSISIINGRMTRQYLAGRIFTYKITPHKIGRYQTGPVSILVAGKTYTHPGLTIEVF